jgi:phage protein U
MPLAKLGNFTFSIETAAFQEIQRTRAWTWAAQERIQARPAHQYTGPGEENINLPGSIFPAWKGNAQSLAPIEDAADQGQPLFLILGTGENLGRWTIINLEQTNTVLFPDSSPRKIDFTLSLQFFDHGNDLQN